MKERPGVVLYFEYGNPLKLLTYEGKGKILEAILNYGEFGEVPDFEENELKIVWGFIQPKLDRDAESYQKKCEKNRHSVYCREEKKHGREPLNFEEWKAAEEAGAEQECSDFEQLRESRIRMLEGYDKEGSQ